MAEIDLYSFLSDDIDINSIVEGRIFPLLMPEGTKMPSIVYSVTNNTDVVSLQGTNYLNTLRIQLDVYAETYPQSKELSAAVKDAMYQFKYFPHDYTSRDLYEKDTQIFRQLIEFKINELGE